MHILAIATCLLSAFHCLVLMLSFTPVQAKESAKYHHSRQRISVIFFTMISRENVNWQYALTQQLEDVRFSGLFAAASSIDAFLSTEETSRFNNEDQELLDQAAKLILDIYPHINVITWIKNHYEFQGIRRFWEVGQKYPYSNHYVLYFHGKGMVNIRTDKRRDPQNKDLTDMVVLKWRDVIRQFERNPTMHTAGQAVSGGGWLWSNFMWARGSHLHNVQKPVLCERRHYYEDWIARKRYPEVSNSSLTCPPCDEIEIGSPCYFGPAHGLSLCKGNRNHTLGYVCDSGNMFECCYQ